MVWFWGVFYGLGYVITFVAFFISMEGPLWEAFLFQVAVLGMALFAVVVMVNVTLAVMRLIGRTPRSNEDAL